MTEVSVLSWNLHQAVDKRADNIVATWRYVEREIRPAVALVQEAIGKEIPQTTGGSFFWPAHVVGYETAVVAYAGKLEPLPGVVTRYSRKVAFPIVPTVPATFAAASVVGIEDVEPFIAVSLYGRMAPLYAQTGVLRAIADLIPLFDAPKLSRRIVLGGDLNVYDQTSDGTMRERWRAILLLLESLGLVNLLKSTRASREPLSECPCRDPECWHVETFRHRRRGASPGFFTTDSLFATPDLAARLMALEIWGDRPGIWELSDHCPLVARFEL